MPGTDRPGPSADPARPANAAPATEEVATAAEEVAAAPEPTEEERIAALERAVDADIAEFGYALGNSVVRRYTVADVHTARKALNDNIGSFLANDRRADVVTRVTDLRTIISGVSILVGIASHAVPIPFPDNYNFVVGCIVVYYALTALSIYAWRVVEGDSFLTAAFPAGSGAASSGKKKGGGKSSSSGNGGGPAKYVQFSSSVERFKAEYHLRAQIIQPAKLPLLPPRYIGAPVERTYFFGKFFSERGLIDPTAVRAEMDKLLADLKINS